MRNQCRTFGIQNLYGFARDLNSNITGCCHFLNVRKVIFTVASSFFICSLFSSMILSQVAVANTPYSNHGNKPGKDPKQDKSRMSTTVTADEAPPPSDPSQDEDKEKNVQDFVENAADYIKKNGKQAAFVEFNKPKGKFTKGSLYIFADDLEGIVLVSPYSHGNLGKNTLNTQGPTGEYVTRDLIAQAKKGAGWIIYKWKNPESKKVECKKTYIQPMQGYYIGAGFYYPPNADGGCRY